MKCTCFALFVATLGCLSLTEALTVLVKYNDAPAGAPFTIVGNSCGMSWNSGPSLSRVASNLYRADIDCTGYSGLLEFKAQLNGAWSIGANFVAQISGNNGTVTVYPWFYKSKGNYVYIRNVWSPQLKNNRDLVVYLPASYFENRKPTYPTLVMHDGQNLFNDSTAFGGMSWGCAETIDNMIVEGQMEPIIVVGVDNTADRLAEYTYSVDPQEGGGKGDIYLDFLRDTVLPIVKAVYPIDTGRSSLGILGSSLGGLISCYAGWTRYTEYSRIGCMSSSFWWNNQDFNTQIMVSHPKPALPTNFYIDSGNAGNSNDGYQETLAVAQHFKKIGFEAGKNFMYYVADGASHNEYYWRQRFHIPMAFLFPPATLTPS